MDENQNVEKTPVKRSIFGNYSRYVILTISTLCLTSVVSNSMVISRGNPEEILTGNPPLRRLISGAELHRHLHEPSAGGVRSQRNHRVRDNGRLRNV